MSNENERNETLTINGVPYVGLSTYADAHGMDVKQLRRYVRNADAPPARKWDTRWLIERDAHVELPDPSTRGRKRADGRQRWVVYIADHDELTAICHVVGADNVVNPRDAAKQRRADKLAAANTVTE